jgi:hypothetical protein
MLATIPLGLSVVDDLLAEDTLAGVLFISAMFLPFYIFVGAPLIAYLIRVAVLRQREFLADADAVLLARSAEPLATALTKMDAADRSGLRVGGATAHLYVVDPLPAGAPWWDRLFSAHPPVDERVTLLAETAGGIPPSVLEVAREAGAASPAAALAPRSVEPTAAGEATTDAWAAPAEVARSPSGFRLTGAGTALYAEPDATSPPLAQLQAGALITVLERDRGFLRVLTADDSFGYILSSVSMAAVEEPAAVASAGSRAATDWKAEAPTERDAARQAESPKGRRQMRQFWNSRIAVAVLAILVVFFVVVPLLEALGEQLPCLGFPPC